MTISPNLSVKLRNHPTHYLVASLMAAYPSDLQWLTAENFLVWIGDINGADIIVDHFEDIADFLESEGILTSSVKNVSPVSPPIREVVYGFNPDYFPA